MDWVNRGRKPETFLRYNRVPSSAKPAYEAAVKEYVGLQKTPGNLYTADLPDEMVDRMLDWDKPLSEQPKAIRDVIGKIVDRDLEVEQGWRKLTGAQALEAVSQRVGKLAKGSDEEVLRQMGIPGIKYSDAGSRGQSGTGTRNFVVFPGEEKKVRILERK